MVQGLWSEFKNRNFKKVNVNCVKMSKTDITFDKNKLQYFLAKKLPRELGVADIEEHQT